MARFFDEKYLQKNYGDLAKLEKYGIFPRDPTMAEFMVSDAAVGAGHLIQHKFETDHAEQDCRNIISNFTRLGGDNGQTMKYIRKACSLPQESDEETKEKKTLPNLLSSSQDDQLEKEDKLLQELSLIHI